MNKIYENTSRSKQHVRVAKKQTIAALEFSLTMSSLSDQYMVQLFEKVLLARSKYSDQTGWVVKLT